MSALDDLPRVAEADAADIAMLVAEGRPAIIRGVASGWPAFAAAQQSPAALNAYLRTMGENVSAPVMEAPASAHGRFGYGPDLREFSFTKRQRPLGETLDRIAALAEQTDGPVVAIQMMPLGQFPAFAADNPMPLLPADAAPRLWLGGPVRTQIHNDTDHNLAVVLAGKRRFVLFPPDQLTNLYMGTPDTPPRLSLVDPEAPDLARFPRFADALATAQVAHLEPGDGVVMPRYWWHHVTSRTPYNAMINYWWDAHPAGIGNPYDVFLTALLGLKDLPPSEREYWRTMFAAYVFQTEGDVLAHLPSALRGSLGTMKPRDREALRQTLKENALRSP